MCEEDRRLNFDDDRRLIRDEDLRILVDDRRLTREGRFPITVLLEARFCWAKATSSAASGSGSHLRFSGFLQIWPLSITCTRIKEDNYIGF